jgi:hypothetical protein
MNCPNCGTAISASALSDESRLARREALKEAAAYIREREIFLRREERHESATYFHFAHQELLIPDTL